MPCLSGTAARSVYRATDVPDELSDRLVQTDLDLPTALDGGDLDGEDEGMELPNRQLREGGRVCVHLLKVTKQKME